MCSIKPLSDEDWLTLVRWIDLGCPIDLKYESELADGRGTGWLLDDQRPTLALTHPKPGRNESFERILIGVHDVYSGLDTESLQVSVNVPLDGAEAGTNLASRFNRISDGVYEWKLTQRVENLGVATLLVSVKDREGNETRVERTFSVQ